MADQNKNKKNSLSEFLRYRQDEMSATERNSFERELQKDPFEEEAMDGLTEINPEDASKDLLELQKRIKLKASRHKRVIIYRIAASVAVLLVISSVYILVERKSSIGQLSVAEAKKEVLEIAENSPLKEPVSKDGLQGNLMEDKDKYQVTKVISESEKAAKTPKGARQKMEIKTQEFPVTEQIPDDDIQAAEVNIAAEQAAAPAKMMTTERATAYVSIKEQKVKSDFEDFINQDDSAYESNEVIITGSKKSRAASEKENTIKDYVPPQPVAGKEAFEKYLQDNQQRPDSATSGQRVVVVVSFMVRNNGTVDSIRIVRSVDKLFSGEAIRLILNGPSWKPAQADGKNIDEEVSVKVVFK